MTEDEALTGLSQYTSEELFKAFMESVGIDTSRPGLENTPARVAKMYREILTPPSFSATLFENDGQYDSLVTVRDIPFYTLCEHHLVPFFGVAHVGYLPDGEILGLSKLAWIVEKRARDLQVQERMSTQIADDIEEAMHPRAIGVVIDAEHLCVSMRGVKKPGSKTRTTVLRGDLLTNASLKEEFITALQR